MKNDLTVIIPTAGFGSRIMHSPKSLIELSNKETLISRQINIIDEKFKPLEIYCVVGFKKDEIKKSIDYLDINFVDNNVFEESNVSYSIGLAVKEIPKERNLLIIYGDLVFNNKIDVPFSSGTCLLSDFSTQNFFKKDEVGINSVNSKVVGMNYGVKNKWSHILYVEKKDRQEFDSVFTDERNKRLFGFESINKLIERGMSFSNIREENVVEIDSYKDLLIANKFIKE